VHHQIPLHRNHQIKIIRWLRSPTVDPLANICNLLAVVLREKLPASLGLYAKIRGGDCVSRAYLKKATASSGVRSRLYRRCTRRQTWLTGDVAGDSKELLPTVPLLITSAMEDGDAPCSHPLLNLRTCRFRRTMAAIEGISSSWVEAARVSSRIARLHYWAAATARTREGVDGE
jgi:hypothetical protein